MPCSSSFSQVVSSCVCFLEEWQPLHKLLKPRPPRPPLTLSPSSKDHIWICQASRLNSTDSPGFSVSLALRAHSAPMPQLLRLQQNLPPPRKSQKHSPDCLGTDSEPPRNWHQLTCPAALLQCSHGPAGTALSRHMGPQGSCTCQACLPMARPCQSNHCQQSWPAPSQPAFHNLSRFW